MITDYSPLWISLKTATTATIITFVLGIFIARWMAGYRGRAKGLIDGLLVLPMVLPPTVIGFILLYTFGRNGPIGQFLMYFDITVIFTWWATVIAATVVAFPLMYKTARAAFEQIDYTYIEAAKTLGYNEWQIFWRVLLPLSWPGVIAGTILAFARALGEFGATLMLAGSIPGKTQTVPVAIFFAVEAGQMERAFAWVVIMVVISLLMVVVTNDWQQRRFAVFAKTRRD
ncbi:molybdate ABC transporter permease subunit [Desulfuribacillus alkaliarsenatis]|uniref:Molybdenum transport system permease n=1 Tax=Desulfuribacillus alkaliarsenatis TaxID=766136 RepID=A0A1E5FZB7_9FIRM|nr:molybdate ABC transporter permease subunit [Desulfuribacillus alkaliarsenatis]OEF95924.1 molybdenum ABC transporter permease subunit [Desulfuribacillus alkaliarsenatis]